MSISITAHISSHFLFYTANQNPGLKTSDSKQKTFYIVIIRDSTHLADDCYEDEISQGGVYSISEYPYLIPLCSPCLSWFTDSVIYRAPKNESQGEERDDDTDQQQPMTPLNSNIKTHHDRGKSHMLYMVAWVMNQVYIIIGMLSLNIFLLSMFMLFNTLCRASCEVVIERYHWNSAPPYIGFNTKMEARDSFEYLQTVGRLPPNIFFLASL